MKIVARAIVLSLLMAFLAGRARSQSDRTTNRSYHLGFDRNSYPGDENLKALHQTFAYTGYWLNNPPGEKKNTWIGHRGAVESAGFGFLVLFNGHLYAELKSVSRAALLGKSDAQAAVATAKREGFPGRTVIFLDQEQGGRMLPEQKVYIYAWLDGVNAGGFSTGIYCSGMAAAEGEGVITAEDIRADAGRRKITYWVTNDACPPSPGCAFPRKPPDPADSGISFAEVWQFAQSPKRAAVAAGCPKDYDRDGSCYAPAVGRIDVDVDAASSEDPSQGRSANH